MTSRAAPETVAPPERIGTRGGGLATALFVYLLAVIAVVTLAPFEFVRPERLRVHASEWTVLDLVANVLLFVPLGFVGAMARSRLTARGAWRALVMGAVVSVAIEGAQLFAPERYTSPWDVLTNAMGAWLGARALVAVRARLDPATVVGRLALDLPLMGLVYLLVPLGWLSALTVGAGAMRPLLLLCLGLFGASILGAVQRRHFGPAGVFSPLGMAAAAAAWIVVASLPALNAAPREVALVALLVAIFTWYRAGGAAGGDTRADAGRDRRFELHALLRAAPFLAAYLLLLPLTDVATARFTRHVILRIVETMTAFTVLGYVVAEAMGRRELRLRDAAVRVVAVAFPVAIVIVALRTVGMPPVDELPRVTAAIIAALYGGWLYDVQRRNVREVLGRR